MYIDQSLLVGLQCSLSIFGPNPEKLYSGLLSGMANRLDPYFVSDYDSQRGDDRLGEDDGDNCESPIGNFYYPTAGNKSGPITPTGRPMGYLQAKRHRPMSEINRFSPYMPRPCEPQNDLSWHEHTDS